MRHRAERGTITSLGSMFVGRGTSVTSSFVPGINGDPGAHVLVPHDVDPDDTAVMDEHLTTFPREGVCCITAAGTVINVVESRRLFLNDNGVAAILVQRLPKNSDEWGPVITAYRVGEGPVGGNDYVADEEWVSVGAIGPDNEPTIHIFVTRWTNDTAAPGDIKILHLVSEDDGLTWTAQDVSLGAKKQDGVTNSQFETSTEWGFMRYTGKILRLGPDALLAIGYHRYTTDTSGHAFTHAMRFNDDVDTFELTGVDEGVVGNRGHIEPWAEVCADGTIYVAMRILAGTGTYSFTRSTDGGDSFADVKALDGVTKSFDGTTDTTLVTGPSTHPLIMVATNGDLILVAPSDPAIRSVLRVYRSRNNGLTWPVSRVFDRGMNGYLCGCVRPGNRYLVIYEITQYFQTMFDESLGVFSDYVRMAEFDNRWIEGQGTEFIDLHLNEFVGPPINNVGMSVRDRGTRGYHAVMGPGGELDSYGLVMDGTDVALILAYFANPSVSGEFGGPWDLMDENTTVEFVIQCSDVDPGGKVIMGNRDAGAGWQCRFYDASPQGRLEFIASDGTTTRTVYSTDVINDGESHAVALVRDADGQVLDIYIDSSQQIATAPHPANGDLVTQVDLSAGAGGAMVNTGGVGGTDRPTYDTDGTYNGVITILGTGSGANADYLEYTGSTNYFDSFHVNGRFAVWFRVKFTDASAPTSQRLIDNRSASAANRGFTVSRIVGTNVLQFGMSGNNGGGNASAGVIAGGAIADTNWHEIEIEGNGTQYSMQIDGGAPTTGPITTANLGTAGAQGALRVGKSRSNSGPAAMKISNLVIINGDPQAADRTHWRSFNPTVDEVLVGTTPDDYTNVALWLPTSHPSLMWVLDVGVRSRTFAPANTVAGTVASVVGAKHDGTSGIAGKIERLKLRRGLPNGFLAPGAAKRTLNQFYGFDPTPPAGAPSSLSSCKFWVASTWDKGYYSRTDQWGGHEIAPRPYNRGRGITTLMDQVGGNNVQAHGGFQGAWWNSDSTIGDHIRVFENSEFDRLKADIGTDLDFIHKTFTGSISLAFKVHTDQDTWLIGNNNFNGGNPGFTLARLSAANGKRVYLHVADGSGTLLESFSLGTLEIDTWYYMGVDFRGSGVPVKIYYGAYPGALAVPTLIELTTATPTAVTDPDDSTQNLRIAKGAYNGDVSLKNVCIFDDDLGLAEHNNRAAFNVAY